LKGSSFSSSWKKWGVIFATHDKCCTCNVYRSAALTPGCKENP
jgi:hypothetical protein